MHRMHVLIAGYGRVGRFLTRMLEYEGHSVSVIDHNPLSLEDEEHEIFGQKFVGEAFDRTTMEEAGIEDADCFAAVTSGDNSNIVAARIAKETYRVPRVLARIYEPRRAEIYRELGIPTISSVSWSGTRLLSMITHPDLHSEYQYGNAEVEMMEVSVPVGLVGRPVSEFEIPGEIHVASIVRNHEAMLPEAGFQFQNEDILYVNVVRESAGKLERLLGLKE